MATILIVDHIPANRAFLATPLRFHGHRLLEAANGREGLAAVRAEHPDLVITDVLLPEVDGFEFLRQLRLDPATSGIPVVVSTTLSSEREARALALSGGVADVLTKSTESAELLKVVDRVLSAESDKPAFAAPSRQATTVEQLACLTAELAFRTLELKTANARLRCLIDLGLTLAAEPDSDVRLAHVCAAARELVGAAYATLGIVGAHDRTVERFVVVGVNGADWTQVGDSLPGVLATVVVERRTMRGENAGGNPMRLGLPARHPPVHTFLAAPIASKTRACGWICVVGNEGRRFTEDDERVVGALADQVGRLCDSENELSAREETERTLRLDRDRAQGYLNTADIILIALDLEGRVTLINQKGSDLLGGTAAELIGRSAFDARTSTRRHGTSRRKLLDLVRADVPTSETAFVTQAGEERLIAWRTTVLRDKDGDVAGTFSSGNDVTERHAAVEALRTAEARIRFALEAAGVGIWDFDYATGAGRWSEVLESQYGVPPGTFHGSFDAFIEGVHPDDRTRVLDTLNTAMATGGDFTLEHRALRPDGTIRSLSGAGRFFLGESGQPVRGVGISLDVTERRTLEQHYQQAQKMESIGRLAGGVAHDFNNLLTVILGYCDLVLDDLDPEDPRQVDMAEIKRAGASATGLTRQLLAFSRKETIEPTLLSLNIVVADMRAMLGRLIEEDVKIVLDLRPELSAVKGDRGQVEQIVMNLALNARDAMLKGGTLTIATANVEVDGSEPSGTNPPAKPGSYVVLTVTDTGAGMTPEVQARMFEPFFTTKEPGTGTGLGLATVQSIAQRSGGHVLSSSVLGRGTAFHVYFPRADEAETGIVTPAPIARPRAEGQIILVVEDADGLRELARRLLQRQGYTVLVAANAEEAVRLFDRTPTIDVLLTDVVMPGMSGPELSRQLLERRPSLKAIYMSGYTKEVISQHGVLDPKIAILHKPFTSESLGRKVREVLSR